jgi:BolA protein
MNESPSMQQHLTEQLEVALSPSYLEVLNESSNHSGPATESHFINQLFKEELGHIHALAMHTYTKDEWAAKGGAPASPQCSGGSKS